MDKAGTLKRVRAVGFPSIEDAERHPFGNLIVHAFDDEKKAFDEALRELDVKLEALRVKNMRNYTQV